MTTAQPGTVISGTLRPQDLIPAFLSALEATDPDTYFDEYELHHCKWRDGPWVAPAEDDPWWDSDEAAEALQTLFDQLESAAPPGHYFGAHPGDGSDFGFWPCETEN